MNRTPKGCSNIGGSVAANMEYCRGALMRLFSAYGYRPFSPAEFQLIEGVWGNISCARARRLIPVMSPFGEPCVLRGDLTLSAVAYLGSHHERSERPLRLSYAERVYSAPLPPRYNLEENQVGVELIGWEGDGADAETTALLLRALDLLGVEKYALVLGDVSILAKFFDGFQREDVRGLTDALRDGAYTKYAALLETLDAPSEKMKLLKRLPSLKGDVGVLEEAASLAPDPSAVYPLRRLCGVLADLGYEKRLRVDLGFVRDLGYYSGPIFNVYSTEDGALLGGGGRYDGLLAKEGIEGQATGFALNLKEIASCCSPPAFEPLIMLWGGGASVGAVLRYAEALSKKKKSFELSWTKDKAASFETAVSRGYKWWVDVGASLAVDVAAKTEISLSEFDLGAFSC